jgi:hypothetical protein
VIICDEVKERDPLVLLERGLRLASKRRTEGTLPSTTIVTLPKEAALLERLNSIGEKITAQASIPPSLPREILSEVLLKILNPEHCALTLQHCPTLASLKTEIRLITFDRVIRALESATELKEIPVVGEPNVRPARIATKLREIAKKLKLEVPPLPRRERR